jgi:hypothetical protein
MIQPGVMGIALCHIKTAREGNDVSLNFFSCLTILTLCIVVILTVIVKTNEMHCI